MDYKRGLKVRQGWGIKDKCDEVDHVIYKKKYLPSDSKNWKCNLKSEEVIEKYLKPLPDPSQSLKSECKKLAKILNKSQLRKPVSEKQSEKFYNVSGISTSKNVTTDGSNELSFDLMDDDMMDDQESETRYNVKQVCI